MSHFVVIAAQLLYLLYPVSSKIVSTKTGDIEGRTVNILGQEVDAYLGIPYAQPPLGELRFKPPKPIDSWKGVHKATHNPPTCMQSDCLEGLYECSEDCLYLNIWVPKNTSDAVMVWIHGGGFMDGSINSETTDGSVMSVVGGVIVVAMSYRLGAFGFLYSGTDDARGNMGMKDQVLALKWIHDNIEAFGGNPSKVTIFGESAGSISVSIHMVSNLSRGLFKSCILQSGTAYQPGLIVRNSSLIKERSTKLAVEVGCAIPGQDISSDPEVMECMREMEATSIVDEDESVAASIVVGKENPWLSLFTPIYGDDYLPNPPIEEMASGNIHVDSFMIGTVTDEGSLFLIQYAAHSLEEMDHPKINKLEATSYIKNLFQGLGNPSSTAVSDYYLSNTSFLDSTLLKRTYDSVGDAAFSCPSVFLSESAFSHGKNVYHFIFNHRWSGSSHSKWMGVVHVDDLTFVFGLPLKDGNSYSPEEVEFSKDLIGAWTSFAKEGKPRYSKLPEGWPLYDSSRRAVDLNAYNVTIVNPYKEACNFWKTYCKP